MMHGRPIIWSNKRQSTVALPTLEAKYMARCAAIQEILFLRKLLANMDHKLIGSTRMLENANGCISLGTNSMTTGKTKHNDIRYHFIREVIKSKASIIEYCPTVDMLADLLTKHVGRMLRGTYSPPPPI